MKQNYKVVGYSMPHFVYCEPTIYEGFTKITLKDGSVIEIKGKGKLTQQHIPSQYTYSDITKIETGLLCTSVGSHINYSSDLTTVIISGNVESIDEEAFYSRNNLKTVIINGPVKTIGNKAFGYCYNMTELVLPEGLLTIGNNAFQNCEKNN